MIINENTPRIETQRLILRRFNLDDAADMLPILSNVEVNRFLPWFPVTTPEQVKKHLADMFLSHYEKPSGYRYAICLKDENKAIGYIGLGEGDSFDFGYGLGKEYWGKGYATEAGLAVVERIKAAGFTFITATHDVNNPKSGEVMKRLGMRYKYSYEELWQPKNFTVTFRMYQLNFDGDDGRTYMGHWDKYPKHYV